MNYESDGKCHNAEPGTFGHECGKPAEWIGEKADGFRSGFCDSCKHHGHEAREYVKWEKFQPTESKKPLSRAQLSMSEKLRLAESMAPLISFLGAPGDWGYGSRLADLTIELKQIRNELEQE